jgi:hypothetical protein
VLTACFLLVHTIKRFHLGMAHWGRAQLFIL